MLLSLLVNLIEKDLELKFYFFSDVPLLTGQIWSSCSLLNCLPLHSWTLSYTNQVFPWHKRSHSQNSYKHKIQVGPSHNQDSWFRNSLFWCTNCTNWQLNKNETKKLGTKLLAHAPWWQELEESLPSSSTTLRSFSNPPAHHIFSTDIRLSFIYLPSEYLFQKVFWLPAPVFIMGVVATGKTVHTSSSKPGERKQPDLKVFLSTSLPMIKISKNKQIKFKGKLYFIYFI